MMSSIDNLSRTRYMNRQQGFEQRAQVLEIQGIGSVRFSFYRVVMNFEKYSIDPGGDRSAGQYWDELRLAPGNSIGSRGSLHGMGSVEDDGCELAHDWKRAHVYHQIVIAEAGSAFGQEDAHVTGSGNLLDRMFHIPGRKELAFFYIDGAPGASGSNQQVGLTAEEGWNLEHISAFSGDFALRGFVDIGQHGQSGRVGETAKNSRAFLQTRAAKAGHRGAVGFVIRSLENIRNAEVGCDALEGIGHFAHMRFALDNAWAGDEEELARADMYVAYFKFVTHIVD